eukprot:Protomagalhaensia_sp_Gyna_25__2907@NODE_26_length_7428_cov_115_375829_g18_i0_p1_GENE_NODE_26_length_7428_cov_115_375829_g18_i0NODE_26_length_7428_cov_115_375829_g18_i0_p1_ORF_typecomplete_len856_score149_46_NODE_26_length_7428_cov_115_375829_g18_i01192686
MSPAFLQPEIYILTPAKHLAMHQPPLSVSWNRWVSFTILSNEIYKQEDDAPAIIDRLHAIYHELTCEGQKRLTVDVFRKWVCQLTREGTEITSHLFGVLDRGGVDHLQESEFVLGVLSALLPLTSASHVKDGEYETSALTKARRQILFMYLNDSGTGLLSDNDFMRMLEIEEEVRQRRKSSLPSGFRSCVSDAAVCVAFGEDLELRVPEPGQNPYVSQVTIVRQATAFIQSQGSWLTYDTFYDALESSIIPDPVYMLHWDHDLAYSLGIKHPGRAQGLNDIRRALNSMIDDGVKAAGSLLRAAATHMHSKVHIPELTPPPVEQVPEPTAPAVVQRPLEPSPGPAARRQQPAALATVQQAVCLEMPPSDHQQKTTFANPVVAEAAMKDAISEAVPESDFGGESILGQEPVLLCEEDNKKSDADNGPDMMLAITTTADEESQESESLHNVSRIESTVSASMSRISSLGAQTCTHIADNDGIFTETSEDAVPDEGIAKPLSVGPQPISLDLDKVTLVRKYVWPLLDYSTRSEILRNLPSQQELVQDFERVAASILPVLGNENIIMELPRDTVKCAVLGKTEGCLLTLATLLKVGLAAFRSAEFLNARDLVPPGACIIQSGSFLCHPQDPWRRADALYGVMVLLALKYQFMDRVVLLRGLYEGPQNFGFQECCMTALGGNRGISIWNKVSDLTESMPIGIRVGRDGIVMGGALTKALGKSMDKLKLLARPFPVPNSAKNLIIGLHTMDLEALYDALSTSLLGEVPGGSDTIEAAIQLRIRKNIRWIVHRQMWGSTSDLSWEAFKVIEVMVDKACKRTTLQCWEDGKWTPLDCGRDLGDVVAQREVHASPGHVITKMSSA